MEPDLPSVAPLLLPYLSLVDRLRLAQVNVSLQRALRSPSALLHINAASHPSSFRLCRFAGYLRVASVRAAFDAEDGLRYYEDQGYRGGARGLDVHGLDGVIRRDVDRTLPQDAWFRRSDSDLSSDEASQASTRPFDAQDMLANVLQSVAAEVSEVGYCQGMNFVAAYMLKACKDFVDEHGLSALMRLMGSDPESLQSAPQEELRALCMEGAVFWIMLAILGLTSKATEERSDRSSEESDAYAMDLRKGGAISAKLLSPQNAYHLTKLRMGGLWRPGVPEMKQRIFEFNALMKLRLPALGRHFRELGLAPDVLVSQWFLTLFAYALEEELLYRAWDACLGGGWASVHSLALALLMLHEEDLLAQDCLEDLGMYLRRCQWGEPGNRAMSLSQGRGIPWGPSAALRQGRSDDSSWECTREDLARRADRLWGPLEQLARQINVTAEELATLCQAYALDVMRERLTRRTDGLLGLYGDGSPVAPEKLSVTEHEIKTLRSEVTAAASGLMAKVEQNQTAATDALAIHRTASQDHEEQVLELEELEASKKALLSQVAAILKLASGAAQPASEAPSKMRMSPSTRRFLPAQEDTRDPLSLHVEYPTAQILNSIVSTASSEGSVAAHGDQGTASAAEEPLEAQPVQEQIEDAPTHKATTSVANAADQPLPKKSEKASPAKAARSQAASNRRSSFASALDRASEMLRRCNPALRSLQVHQASGSESKQAALDPEKEAASVEHVEVDEQVMEDLTYFARKVEALERKIQQHKAGPLRATFERQQETEMILQETRDALAASVTSLRFYLEKTEEELNSFLLARSPEAKAIVANVPGGFGSVANSSPQVA
uniref:Rab-GAP TBC domain-containing protein n=1 Tax=Pinguiococcus pyrenoidosus TaxID=172671 RepID=A0A7R9YCC5_9STRA|mmetsp:Transcript_17924/g.67994  ORF Transcript_17924/g.67994 Transcript_17924/m.67994 type:complete len:838 (+) Transcript_17924:97-2610(+)